jgi:hypothetical protein
MAAKIDKEVLIKHHFWILTGLFVLLVLIPLFCLVGSVSGTVAKGREDLEGAKKQAKGVPASPPNGQWEKAYKKADGYVEKKQDQVWKQAWELQKDMVTWPEGLLAEFPQFKDMYFGDPINQYQAQKFSEEYGSQLFELPGIIRPLMPDGTGVVQASGKWTDLLQLHRTFTVLPPSREDVWLSQEDFWVKRELLRVVRAANDAVGRFQEVKQLKTAAPKDAKGKAAVQPEDRNHKIFRNPFWEVELTLAQNAKREYVLRGKITNIGKHREPLDALLVYLTNPPFELSTKPAVVAIEHEPVPVGESVDIKETKIDQTQSIDGITGVEQMLSWRTAPVKRIDQLLIDYKSSRNAGRALQPPPWIEKATTETAPSTGATPGAAPGAPSGGPTGGGGDIKNSMAMMMGGMRPGGGGSGQGGTSKNGLQLNRYTDPEDKLANRLNPVRHMPVAMVVIMDEEQIHEFLGAFANSKLRIQVLQCHWHHTREKIKPQSESTGTVADKGRKTGGARPAQGGKSMGELGMAGFAGRGGMMGGMMMGQAGMPGTMPGGFAGPGNLNRGDEDEEEAEATLVEVSVYGLASLYSKFPPKPEETSTAQAAK